MFHKWSLDKIENSPSAKYRTRSTSGSVDLHNKRFIPSNNGRLKSNLSHKRRCSRSVKFSGKEKECSGCIENKQVLSMTTHVRASSSRSQSTEKKRRSKISKDLLSWETPEKHLARVRRSQNKRASSSLI